MESEEKIAQIITHADISNLTDKEALVNSLSIQPIVSVRFNPFKNPRQKPVGEKVSWCPEGIYLTERPVFALDPNWHAGAYYVQEASSMFAGTLFSRLKSPDTPVKILDLCAAPGGKSTHLISEMNNDDLLVSNEVTRNRVLPLTDNIQRWGRSNVVISNANSESISRLEDYFDIILADMPCSGEGMIRKDPFALKQWNEGLVNQCSSLQKNLLKDSWNALKPGGIFIYSTCTFNRKENEENIAFAAEELGAEPVHFSEVPDGVTITKSNGISCYRFFPHLLKGEGFFISVFKKPEGNLSTRSNKKEKNFNPIPVPDLIKNLAENTDLVLREWNNGFYLQNEKQVSEISFLTKTIHTVSPGTRAGNFAGKDFIPDHAVAMLADASQFLPGVDIREDDAASYLRKEAVSVSPQEIADKWITVNFEGLPLGWIKKAGNRFNNYYPGPLKIRKQR